MNAASMRFGFARWVIFNQPNDSFPSHQPLNLQKGFGPAFAEVVPCMGAWMAGTSTPVGVPFLLDNPEAGVKTVLLRAHPVGVAALLYWDAGALGYDIKRGRWRDAADRLVGCALAGEVGSTSEKGAASETFRRLLSACRNQSHLHHFTAHHEGGGSGTQPSHARA